MALSVDDFKPLSIADKPFFDALAARGFVQHSENVFTTLLSWQHHTKISLARVGDAAVLMQDCVGNRCFRVPIGPYDRRLVSEVASLAVAEGGDPGLLAVQADAKAGLARDFPSLRLDPVRDFFDYVYEAEALAKLAGKNYLKIRTTINGFKRQYKHAVEPVGEGNFKEVREFLNRWCLWKHCSEHPMLELEKQAILTSMGNFFPLKLSGIVVRIDGEIQALSVFERMDAETAVIHYEKGVADFEGIYQIVNQEAAVLLAKDHRFINRESDMGVPNLRQAKERYRPHHMVEIYRMDRSELDKLAGGGG